MNCKFCAKDMGDSSETAQEGSNHKSFFETYTCHPCSAIFTIIAQNGYAVETILFSGEYRIVLNNDKGSCVIQKQEPNYQGTYTGGHLWWEVLRLPHSPANITPQNVADKIKTILIFS